MKPTRKLKYCEYCDKAIEDISPPSPESYENGEIFIRDGTVLLPKKLSKPSDHSKFIDGTYCNIKCLTAHIKNILKIKD